MMSDDGTPEDAVRSQRLVLTLDGVRGSFYCPRLVWKIFGWLGENKIIEETELGSSWS